MLNEKDLNYLQWIAKRLVNKYREDPQILILVDEIIAKIIGENQTNKIYNELITNNIPNCINILQEVLTFNQKIPTVNRDKTTQLLIDKNTSTFENINLSEIFK